MGLGDETRPRMGLGPWTGVLSSGSVSAGSASAAQRGAGQSARWEPSSGVRAPRCFVLAVGGPEWSSMSADQAGSSALGL